MIKHKILKKENISVLFISFLCGILIPFLNINTDLLDMYNLEQIFIMAREIWVEPGEFSPEVICVIIPLSLLFVFIFNSMTDDYAIVKNYIFIRFGNIKKWFFYNSLFLLIISITSSFLYNAGVFFVCIMLGFKLTNMKIMLEILLYSVFGMAILLYIISTISITISFFTEIKNSIFISIFFLVASIITSTLLPAKITKWLWTSHYFVFWHKPEENIIVLLNGNTIFESGNTTTFLFSVVFLLAFAGIATTISYRFINKSDYI